MFEKVRRCLRIYVVKSPVWRLDMPTFIYLSLGKFLCVDREFFFVSARSLNIGPYRIL